MKRPTSSAASIVLVLSLACQNQLKGDIRESVFTRTNADTLGSLVKSSPAVTEDEKALLALYLARRVEQEGAVPLIGMTVGEALEAQRQFLRLQADRNHRQERLNSMVDCKVTNKVGREAFDYSCTNTSPFALAAFRGALTIVDRSGLLLHREYVEKLWTLAPGESRQALGTFRKIVPERGSLFKKLSPEDEELVRQPLEALTVTWQVEAIAFQEGSVFKISDEDIR